MNYLVSTTWSPQVQWKLELMIESFKYLGIQEKLHIYLSINKNHNFYPSFKHNLTNFKNLYLTDNYGKSKGFEPLNTINNLIIALKDKTIDKQFVFVPEHCVIYREPILIEESFSCKFQTNLLFSPECLQEKINLKENFDTDPSAVTTESWPYAEKLLQFNDFPISFYEELLELTEKFVFNQYNNKIYPAKETIQLAINVHLKNYLGKFNPIQTTQFSSTLLDNEIHDFVNYEKGYYPIFDNSMFNFNPIATGNPFKVLSDNKPTVSFAYVSGIAGRYLANTKA